MSRTFRRLGPRCLDDGGRGLWILAALQQCRKHQRRHNRGIRFNDEHRRLLGELVPSDLLIGRCAGVTAVTGSAVRDLDRKSVGRERVYSGV